ncbi:hypothetical protein QYE76_014769 [Lolium multiflorum]|uniref:Uncharacterized protein n=1 Tax=Lolium multiflorum TaxID=4521 RepID=A0AAD8X8H4_LOLMU|nr:hypothetical protein QYE76_014769 [Lolium multiflorum]
MAKLAFSAAVFLVLVALSAAEGDNILQLPCKLQLQQSSLDSCRRVVDNQLAARRPFFLSPQALIAKWVQAHCCQQLRDISRECRATAIRQIVSQYEHQAMVPLGGGSYYPGTDKEQQGDVQQEQSWKQQQQHLQGQGLFQHSETSPQQQGQGWYLPGHPSQTVPQQQGQGWYLPSQTFPPQQGQGWYLPGQTFPQQHGQGWYLPGQTFPQQQGQGWYPGQTFPLKQGPGWYAPSQTSQQQQEPEWYLPSQTFPQQQPGSYRPSQTFPQQQQPGSYHPGQTFPHQQQQGGGFSGDSTVQQQKKSFGDIWHSIFHHGQKPAAGHESFGEAAQHQEQGPSYTSETFPQQQHMEGSFGESTTKQQKGSQDPSHLPQQEGQGQSARLELVTRARQVAAQLPAICRLEGQ